MNPIEQLNDDDDNDYDDDEDDDDSDINDSYHVIINNLKTKFYTS